MHSRGCVSGLGARGERPCCLGVERGLCCHRRGFGAAGFWPVRLSSGLAQPSWLHGAAALAGRPFAATAFLAGAAALAGAAFFVRCGSLLGGCCLFRWCCFLGGYGLLLSRFLGAAFFAATASGGAAFLAATAFWHQRCPSWRLRPWALQLFSQARRPFRGAAVFVTAAFLAALQLCRSRFLCRCCGLLGGCSLLTGAAFWVLRRVFFAVAIISPWVSGAKNTPRLHWARSDSW